MILNVNHIFYRETNPHPKNYLKKKSQKYGIPFPDALIPELFEFLKLDFSFLSCEPTNICFVYVTIFFYIDFNFLLGPMPVKSKREGRGEEPATASARSPLSDVRGIT
jgi:hypothetical protein